MIIEFIFKYREILHFFFKVFMIYLHNVHVCVPMCCGIYVEVRANW